MFYTSQVELPWKVLWIDGEHAKLLLVGPNQHLTSEYGWHSNHSIPNPWDISMENSVNPDLQWTESHSMNPRAHPSDRLQSKIAEKKSRLMYRIYMNLHHGKSVRAVLSYRYLFTCWQLIKYTRPLNLWYRCSQASLEKVTAVFLPHHPLLRLEHHFTTSRLDVLYVRSWQHLQGKITSGFTQQLHISFNSAVL